MKIEYKDINDLIPYVNNTRTHSEEQINQIASSIKEFGFTNPVLIDKNDGLIAGHGRVMGAKKLGLKEVPTITLDNLTEAQKKLYIIADNKIALNAGWDEELLKIELQSLQEMDFDLSLTGFNMDELLAMDIDLDLREDGSGTGDEKYTHKIESPIYEIKGELPDINDLYNLEKTNKLTEEILKTDIPKDVKDFLISASNRHIVFNYEKIAEFYAHQNKEIQKLMEKSALVIIDFNQAIENGFVTFSKNIEEILQNTQDE